MEKVEMNSNIASASILFLTGLGVGIALTVLLTPRSGAATRRLIGRKIEKGEGWMKNKAAVARDYVRGCEEELHDRAKELVEVIGRS